MCASNELARSSIDVHGFGRACICGREQRLYAALTLIVTAELAAGAHVAYFPNDCRDPLMDIETESLADAFSKFPAALSTPPVKVLLVA